MLTTQTLSPTRPASPVKYARTAHRAHPARSFALLNFDRHCSSGSPSAAVAEHLAQTLLLVRPERCVRLEVDVQVLVHRVVAEIVLRQQGKLQLDAALLQGLDAVLLNLHSGPDTVPDKCMWTGCPLSAFG